MMRLRQVALVARDLDAAVAEVQQNLTVDVCFRDPGVSEFGLHNALFRIGDQFLEIVSPVTTGTTAGRLLDKMGGDCGYMAIFEVDDLDERMRHLTQHGVRTVWQGDFRQIRGRHLHPKDTGGTLVSMDQPERPGEWHWAGPNWRDSRRSTVASAITGITLASADPVRLRERWQELDIDTDTNYVSDLGDAERLTAVTLKSTNDADLGRRFTICGVEFNLV